MRNWKGSPIVSSLGEQTAKRLSLGFCTKITDWDSHIGRKLKLRDLHVFFMVVQHGSLAKAASNLGVSHPAISQLMNDLEHAVGVRLLDRGSRGVTPTVWACACCTRACCIRRLKQGIRDIEFLSNPLPGGS
jgi:hypothetical protein